MAFGAMDGLEIIYSNMLPDYARDLSLNGMP